MVASVVRAFEPKHVVWLKPLAERCVSQYVSKPSLDSLMKMIAADVEFRLALKVNNVKSVRLSRILEGRSIVAVRWNLPRIDSYHDLANWLGIRRRDLGWLANLHSSVPRRSCQTGKHYVCTWIRKRSSGLRLIESPKPILKDAQTQINAEILSRIEPHDAAHGFRRGRSVVSFVQAHVNKPVCLKMDLKNFFPSVTFGRAWGVFRNSGYSRDVARTLAAICTCATQADVLKDDLIGSVENRKSLEKVYGKRHLPQGAPTSPAVSNLVAYGMDARLRGLASSQGFAYTRYADDLLFSGDEQLAKCAQRFAATVGAIALEEGFQVQYRKTRLMRASQRQLATGIVINQAKNIPRRQFDQLKAILFNCVRNGPHNENRNREPDFRRHLEGRIQWATQLNPMKASKLQALFSQIDWET